MPNTTDPAAATAEAPISFDQAAEVFFRDLGEIEVRLGPDGPWLTENLILRMVDLLCATARKYKARPSS